MDRELGMAGVGYVVKRMTITIKRGTDAAVAYECAITGVTETETHDTATSQTACADGTITDVGPSSYSVTVGGNVSLAPSSLFRVLREHAGSAAVLSVEPFPDREPGHKVEWDVVLVGPGADYTVGSFSAFSVELPVTGAPRFVDPVAP
jgi:hypothetical protein